jgi:hypothetical protein
VRSYNLLEMIAAAAPIRDIRLAGGMLHALTQLWAGTLGGPPDPHSPLGSELAGQDSHATTYLGEPFQQIAGTAMVLGNIAGNHERILQQTLIDHANDQARPCPVAVVPTLCRAAFDSYAAEVWLLGTPLTPKQRLARYLALDYEGLRAYTLNHRTDERLQRLVATADELGISRDNKGRWVGEPTSLTMRAENLMAQYGQLGEGASVPAFGRTMYKILSGPLHGNPHSIPSLLVEFEKESDSDSGRPNVTFGLQPGLLWQCMTLLLIAMLTSRLSYAAWIGRAIPPEPLRVHRLHIDLAARKWLGLPTHGGV